MLIGCLFLRPKVLFVPIQEDRCFVRTSATDVYGVILRGCSTPDSACCRVEYANARRAMCPDGIPKGRQEACGPAEAALVVVLKVSDQFAHLNDRETAESSGLSRGDDVGDA